MVFRILDIGQVLSICLMVLAFLEMIRREAKDRGNKRCNGYDPKTDVPSLKPFLYGLKLF